MRALIVCSFLLTACAGGPPSRPDARDFWSELGAPPSARNAGMHGGRVFKIRSLEGKDRRLVNRGLEYYVKGPVENWEVERAILCEDALRGYHLARALALFAYAAKTKTGRRGEILVGEPAWERPIAELVKMGEVAVPCVVIDLLPSRHSEYRELGVEVAVRMGGSVLPTFQRALQVEDARTRRLAAEILASWDPTSPVREALRRASHDDDFGVRAGAWCGLARAAGEDLPAVLKALREEDAFVQRALAGGLADRREESVVLALVDYMEAAIRAGDRAGGEAAEAALRKISGRKGRSNLEAWRIWAASYQAPVAPVQKPESEAGPAPATKN